MTGRHRASRLIGRRVIEPAEVGLPEPFCRCGHEEGLHGGAERVCGGFVGIERCTCLGYLEGRLSVVVREEILERAARRRRRSADAGEVTP